MSENQTATAYIEMIVKLIAFPVNACLLIGFFVGR